MQTKDVERTKIILSALRRKKAKRDIRFFADYYLSHFLKHKTPAFHEEIYSLLQENRLAIAAPRSFAKSTIVQIVKALHVLLLGKEEDILTISQSSSLAGEWIRKLKIEMETNPKILEDFGLMYKWGPEISKKWTEEHLTIDSYDGKIVNQIRSKGRGCQVRGFRPTRIFCDDLEDDELVRSSEQRGKLAHWFKGALMNTITLNQQFVVIGTLLHPLSLLKQIIDKDPPFDEWETRKYKALTDGKSIWEEKWPTKELERRKMEIGTYAFEAEFQNNPMASESVLFKSDWIRTHNTTPKCVFKIMAVDLASSEKESADESAFVGLGLTEEGEIYELDSLSGRWGLWDLVDNFYAFYGQQNYDKVVIEKVAFQEVMKPILQAEGKKRNILSLPIKQVTVGYYSSKDRKEAKDKWTRAYKVTHLFENGKVFLKSKKLIDQLIVFPTGDHDDLADAMVYAILALKDFNKKAAIFSEKKPSSLKGLGIAPATPLFAPPPRYALPGKKYNWKTAA